MERWPFADPANTAVFTTRAVVIGDLPILSVWHDEDDGAWQFLPGGVPQEEDASIVSLKEIVTIDPTVAELADLPVGWVAWPPAAGRPWTRSRAADQVGPLPTPAPLA